MATPLSPTTRSTPRREKERAQSDRAALYDVLDASLICHLGVVVDGVPLALPTVFGVDPDGPDEGGTLYIHGSVASLSLVQGPDRDVSATMTVLDGIVLALPLHEASVKRRVGDPSDEDFDVEAGGVWAGVVPLGLLVGDPVTGGDADGIDVPAHVLDRVGSLRLE
jgi:hypothetical protein